MKAKYDTSVPQKIDLLQAALWYAREKGWAVFPCHTVDENGVCSCRERERCDNPGKHPRIKGWKEYATTDPDQIREWWKLWPDANIGLATGAASGVIALDVDPGDGGEASLATLEEEHGAIPHTAISITGSGGRHILFKYPGWYVPPSVGKNGGVAPGLDIRGDGALIILPPSLHKSGRRYQWDPAADPWHIEEMAEVPEWLATRIRQKTTRRAQTVKAKTTGRVWEQYLQSSPIPEGTRDDTLFRIGCAMRARGAGYEDILATLTRVNELRCNPPLDWKQVEQKAAQAAKYPPGPSGLLDFPATDLGNAERLVDRHGADLKYCAKLGGWHVWDGKRWILDETGEIYRRAAETVREYRRMAEEKVREISEAAETAPANEQEQMKAAKKAAEAVAKFARASESRPRLEAMVNLAQSQPGIPAVTDDFDANPFLLTVGNGTLDLKTGKLREHRREDLITKMIPVDYDPAATCPRWEAFLDEVMAGDQEMVEYLQKAVGYSLTGDTGEQVLFFLHGSGANGKSVFLNLVQELTGDYGQQAPPSLLMARPNEGIPNDVARIRGARFVAAIETDDGKRMAEALVKQLTGGDPITARFLRQEFFQFKPQAKIWLASNHKPIILGDDYAIWRRIHLIPFEVTIPPEKRDKRLPDKLREELPGILRWAVEGLRKWMAEGLNPPEKVLAATEDYKSEMDKIGAFLEEMCFVNPLAKVTVKELYDQYKIWCMDSGVRPLSKQRFNQKLEERGFNKERGNYGKMWWYGLGLSADDDFDENDDKIPVKSEIKQGISQFQNKPELTHQTHQNHQQEIAATRERRGGYL